MNIYETDLTPVKQSVFRRLYELSQKPKKPAELSEVKKIPSKPREEIEKDLMDRHYKSQGRLYTKRAEKADRELQTTKSRPTISQKSKQLLKRPKEPEVKEAPKEVVKIANQLKARTGSYSQTGTILIHDDSNLSSGLDLKIDLSRFVCSRVKDQSESFGKDKTQKFTPHGINYDTINLTKNSSSNEKTEEKPVKYFDMKQGIHERTQHWLREIERNNKEKKDKNKDGELKECTFKPSLSKYDPQKIRKPSPTTNVNTLKVTQYSALSANNKGVAFPSGFNNQAFCARSKLMVEYKAHK